jgi:hypothetical protein
LSEKGKDNNRSRFPRGMTERKATARTEADPPPLAKDDKPWGQQGGSRFPERRTERKAREEARAREG